MYQSIPHSLLYLSITFGVSSTKYTVLLCCLVFLSSSYTYTHWPLSPSLLHTTTHTHTIYSFNLFPIYNKLLDTHTKFHFHSFPIETNPNQPTDPGPQIPDNNYRLPMKLNTRHTQLSTLTFSHCVINSFSFKILFSSCSCIIPFY